MRWPGVIKPGQLIHEICSLQDFIPTFAAANGEPDLVEKMKKGYKIGDKTYKVYLDGYNLLPFLGGDQKESPRVTRAESNINRQEKTMAKSAKNGKQPNILVIWGDDIGQSNLSCYTHGLMGYHTPNIDRLAKEGMLFTDSYGEQSCTAGRSAFITGQSVYRTGLSKVGIPAAPQGMPDSIVTIAELLKNQGYTTGQFGKNHLGDLNKHLPTVHGFDEFFGNLYHLNAEEEPEMANYPTDKDIPNFRERFGPRGVIHSWATDKDDPTEMPRWGRVGKQKIEDTGPLTKKRMETCDDDFVAAAKDFIKRANDAGTPFFVWLNTTHMHLFTHTKPESLG